MCLIFYYIVFQYNILSSLLLFLSSVCLWYNQVVKKAKQTHNILKKEPVLVISLILALITCFFVPIDQDYINYFDYGTLCSLFSMLLVVSAMKSTFAFDFFSRKLVGAFKTRRGVISALVFGTFFFDMVVANDMSLITFLPLTYLVLHSTNNDKYLAITFVLQTIAANMGGMITPYGNPQNLYLYSHYHIGTLEFFSTLIVQSIVVAIMLFICCRFIKNAPLKLKKTPLKKVSKTKFLIYAGLFVLTILGVFRIIPFLLALAIVVGVIFVIDKKNFRNVDYALLATFCAFFVFSSNMARIDVVQSFISEIVVKNTLLAGIVSCQLISNVPTAIFLSRFTENYQDLLVSVNIGSLGILVSSLASLITLKEFLRHQPKKFWKYLGLFTLFNSLFLAVLVIVTVVK